MLRTTTLSIARNLAFPEGFNATVLYSWYLDNLLGCHLGCPWDSALRQPDLAQVLSYHLSLAFILPCFLAFWGSWIRKKDHACTRSALQALLTVVVPTCSLWSHHYVKLARVLHSRVDIPLGVIIKDTVDGVVEFRNPVNDLADLVSSGVTAGGYTIRIKVDWRWWIDCFEWWMLAKSSSDHLLLGSPGYTSELSGWLKLEVPTTNFSSGLCSTPFALASSTSCPLLCLDRLPPGIIPSLNPGSKVTLEFTTFSPSLRTLSKVQVISAIPFILSNCPRRRPRSLISVLKQLNASYGPSLVLDSVSNVSVDYEHALRCVHKSLSGEQRIRELWVEISGIKAWRRDTFLVALEAALLRRGWIERWAIQVTVK